MISYQYFSLAATIAFVSFHVVSGFAPCLTTSYFLTSTSPSSDNAARYRKTVDYYCTPILDKESYEKRSISRLYSTASSPPPGETEKIIPLTLLAGFLGSGKTTTLQNLLTNNGGLKIGIIVNDVASINIDSKLLANPNVSSEETIELQNGCACCSLADELLTSVENMMKGGRELDAIVVELSGVADPVAVRSNWEQAEFSNHPATMLGVKMDKVVTLVDSSTFGTDWMTWDTSGDRKEWGLNPDDCEANKNIPELLAEQVEAADVLVINKIDLAGEEQVAIATSLAKGLNAQATIFETKFGEISVMDVLQAAKVDRESKEEECIDLGCTDTSHSHDHDHEEVCSDRTCTDTSHSHSNDQGEACNDPVCTDTSHSHSHNHDHGKVCNDPGCTDASHSHSHDRSTSAQNLGISNFVYTSNRPFNPTKLLSVINKWPVPIKEKLDLGQIAEATEEGYDIDGNDEKSPFVGVLRSKGFCWMAPTQWTGENEDVWRHNTSMYWSHAGKHFGLSTVGKWWATIPPETLKKYFILDMKEYERIMREDFVSEEFGDRRQEVVFIGVGIDEIEITAALDDCLCDDEDMEVYRKELRNFEDSKKAMYTKSWKK